MIPVSQVGGGGEAEMFFPVNHQMLIVKNMILFSISFFPFLSCFYFCSVLFLFFCEVCAIINPIPQMEKLVCRDDLSKRHRASGRHSGFRAHALVQAKYHNSGFFGIR